MTEPNNDKVTDDVKAGQSQQADPLQAPNTTTTTQTPTTPASQTPSNTGTTPSNTPAGPSNTPTS